MYKKLVLSFLLILSLSLVLTGCFSSPVNNTGTDQDIGDNTNDNLVWQEFTGDYFSISYPAEWQYDSDTTDLGSEGKMHFYAFAEQVDFSKEIVQKPVGMVVYEPNWFDRIETTKSQEDYLEQEWNNDIDYYKSEDRFVSKDKYELDGKMAFEVVYNNKEEGTREKYVSTYDGKDLYGIYFIENQSEFADTKQLGEKLIDSFKFVN